MHHTAHAPNSPGACFGHRRVPPPPVINNAAGHLAPIIAMKSVTSPAQTSLTGDSTKSDSRTGDPDVESPKLAKSAEPRSADFSNMSPPTGPTLEDFKIITAIDGKMEIQLADGTKFILGDHTNEETIIRRWHDDPAYLPSVMDKHSDHYASRSLTESNHNT
ncbi:hypothetical protein pqer_cds_942 [Pandoravirus quercus]|uniref:Uncharacterized protein n=2 Tax=Pandoravirus TaxID=2060084 RepID=A0A2U7UAA2_9VIRU|nr:hypothetical protein pqer_cds_942 [Pandoravirus quercus]AVK75364.1 hypothetical protein pqer_cds_942 [Pandoravirus quercus]QBZ81542.1 hypothetical protein pclt_cds_956 [Pandoravirus celtis]